MIFCNTILAEDWPTLDECVKLCVLIVKCKTEMEKDLIKYRVLETWKGNYSPDLFYHRPPEGYLYNNTWHGNENPKEGQEIIFFFEVDNQSSSTEKEKLFFHSTAFPIKEGKIIYASTNIMMRKEYKVEAFKKEILSIVEKQKTKEELPNV